MLLLIDLESGLMNYRNKYELRIFGIKRSGNHAITLWLASLFNKPVYFFNACKIDPYRTPLPFTELDDNIKHIMYQNEDMYRLDEEQIKPLRELEKECIIYRYEDTQLKEFNDFINKYIDFNYVIGSSKYKYNIIILRDFYNFAASTIYKRRGELLSYHVNKCNELNKEKWVKDASMIWTRGYYRLYIKSRLWKDYAKEYIGQTNILKNKLVISFNEWFSSEEYRRNIADKIGVKYCDITINNVAQFGQGSSFSGTSYNGKATELDVLNRWKLFKDNNIYWDIVNSDKEIIQLSNDIFGEIINK